ncbi:MAG: chemotaxis protein CheX [Bacillota bacterium]|nr:chemotaxis protein CheX [Bacillota bacterium]
MKVEYINPFLTASSDILKQVCNINVEKKPLFIKQGILNLKEITITVGITGDVKGNLILNLDKSTALIIASRMMGGFEVTELNEIAASAVSELGNMIAGQSGMHFSSLNKNIDITPPIMHINSKDAQMNYEQQTVCVPMHLDVDGIIEVDISLI